MNPLFWMLPVSGVLLMAGNSVWQDKPIPSWTPEDARRILTDSPWSKIVVAGITRRESEDERRAGGEMGQSKGVGFDGVDDVRVKPQLPNNVAGLLFKPSPYVPPPPKYLNLRIRWESALPVRAAELRTGVIAPPTLFVPKRLRPHGCAHRRISTSSVISGLTRSAIQRAGVESVRKGAHIFRHSLATAMLRQGASLDEIGQVLRHKDADTTAIYAKVDLDALRRLAVAWPGGGREQARKGRGPLPRTCVER